MSNQAKAIMPYDMSEDIAREIAIGVCGVESEWPTFRHAAARVLNNSGVYTMVEALRKAEQHFAGEPFDPSARECLTFIRDVLADVPGETNA